MVLGKHSGKHALREKLESMGYELTDEELERCVQPNFKELADKKKTITGSDIEALVLNRRNTAAAACELVSHVVNAGDGLPNTSCVKIKRDDRGAAGGGHRHRPAGRVLQGHQPDARTWT